MGILWLVLIMVGHYWAVWPLCLFSNGPGTTYKGDLSFPRYIAWDWTDNGTTLCRPEESFLHNDI